VDRTSGIEVEIEPRWAGFCGEDGALADPEDIVTERRLALSKEPMLNGHISQLEERVNYSGKHTS